HLVRSFVQVRASVPATHLLIVGDGTQRQALEQLVRASGLDGSVHFAGALSETRVALSLMDVFVFLPAQQEGFGLSLLEAMASGRAIVAVRRGQGAPWVLEESGVGTLVEPDDPAALGRAVAQLLQDGEAACRQAGQARAVVKERYSLSRMVDQVEGVYRQLIR
ncbi:MAG: glycosyltransferase family 4 protein, partial [Candidatus Omnitrophota bacterium]|nr:glycosyltransferase family 4 protein [Candidatus Omnitrophota bacterium]